MKKLLKSVLFLWSLAFAFAGYTATRIPDTLYVANGRPVYINSLPVVTFSRRGKENTRAVSREGRPVNYTASFMGLFPLKEVSVTYSQARYVNVSGRPFGIKMFCDGVLVVGFSDILTSSGYQNPARTAGLEMGDVITKVDGKRVQTNEDVAAAVEKSGGSVRIEYTRAGKNRSATITPVTDINTKTLRTGMWVRDSGAGIGTMTFYDEDKGYFSGLGHGIKDVDTHTELPLLSGEIVPVKITGVVKSKNGSAGRLKGNFTSVAPSGKVLSNGTTGVYGKSYVTTEQNMMPVASPTQVKTGKAYILTTINGTKPGMYEVQIEKVSLTASDPNKNLVIRVTDQRLLALTGGIVAGMSGSPIIQDGYLVGAVTHVFVNQVERGYGIFASNMLATLDSVYLRENAA